MISPGRVMEIRELRVVRVVRVVLWMSTKAGERERDRVTSRIQPHEPLGMIRSEMDCLLIANLHDQLRLVWIGSSCIAFHWNGNYLYPNIIIVCCMVSAWWQIESKITETEVSLEAGSEFHRIESRFHLTV